MTGASDGIGKEFSFQLAKAGFNIFLVARNATVLDTTAAEIRMEHGSCVIRKINVLTGSKYPQISTRIHSIDFSTCDEGVYAKLSEVIRDLNIGVLGKPGFNNEFMAVVIQHL